MTNRDAMRTVMNRVPSAEVTFVDPTLQEFFDDERAGLCTVEVKRISPIQVVPTVVISQDVQHYVIVRYHDPELEMVRKLSI